MICLSPLCDAENEYDQLVLFRVIYYAVIANAQPPETLESPLQALTKVRVIFQSGNSFEYSQRLDTVNRTQFPGGPRLPLYIIGGHAPGGGLRVLSGALSDVSAVLPQ